MQRWVRKIVRGLFAQNSVRFNRTLAAFRSFYVWSPSVIFIFLLWYLTSFKEQKRCSECFIIYSKYFFLSVLIKRNEKLNYLEIQVLVIIINNNIQDSLLKILLIVLSNVMEWAISLLNKWTSYTSYLRIYRLVRCGRTCVAIVFFTLYSR